MTHARENARGIRENISAEMWENLNALYWSLRSEDTPNRFDESPDDLFRSVMAGSMLFQGLTDQTLAHDQRWQFTQLAKYLERTDVTCRVIQTKYDILKSNEQIFDSTLRNLHWMAVLRSCCSIEAYRRNYLGDMDPTRVAGFLILERNFPAASASAFRGWGRSSRSGRDRAGTRSIRRSESWAGLTHSLNIASFRRFCPKGSPTISSESRRPCTRRRWPFSSHTLCIKDSSMLLKSCIKPN